jgi:hypothetical protein
MEKTVGGVGILNSDLFSDQFFLQCMPRWCKGLYSVDTSSCSSGSCGEDMFMCSTDLCKLDMSRWNLGPSGVDTYMCTGAAQVSVVEAPPWAEPAPNSYSPTRTGAAHVPVVQHRPLCCWHYGNTFVMSLLSKGKQTKALIVEFFFCWCKTN